MSNEERQLLKVDLSGRLPYNVKVQFMLPDYNNNTFTEEIGELVSFGVYGERRIHSKGIDYYDVRGNCKPFLRTIGSMTKAEQEEYFPLLHEPLHPETALDLLNWLNKHHFDYNHLINRGLAIKAPKGMYEYDKDI